MANLEELTLSLTKHGALAVCAGVARSEVEISVCAVDAGFLIADQLTARVAEGAMIASR